MSDFNDVLKCIQATGKLPQDSSSTENGIQKKSTKTVKSTNKNNQPNRTAYFALEFMVDKNDK